jgi:hypothetical protein
MGTIYLDSLRGYQQDPWRGPMGDEPSGSELSDDKHAEEYRHVTWMPTISGGSISDVDRLLLEAAADARQLPDDEVRQVCEHIARVGFDPNGQEAVRGRLAGIV